VADVVGGASSPVLFDLEIFRSVALKEKLGSRLGFGKGEYDVPDPLPFARPCLLKTGILDLVGSLDVPRCPFVADSLRRPLREKDRSVWDASRRPSPKGLVPYDRFIEFSDDFAFLSYSKN
jgi:hypothetical protein